MKKTHMIKRRLTAISVRSASLYGAIVAFIAAYPCVGLVVFFQYFDPQRTDRPGPWWAFWIVTPAMLALVSALLTAIACAAYNLSARLLGGVRYTVCDDDAAEVDPADRTPVTR
jgi:hypothetical protein